MAFIVKEDAYSMTFIGVFLPFAYCQLFKLQGDAYNMTIVLGLNQNPVNPKIMQILILTMCGKICGNLRNQRANDVGVAAL